MHEHIHICLFLCARGSQPNSIVSTHNSGGENQMERMTHHFANNESVPRKVLREMCITFGQTTFVRIMLLPKNSFIHVRSDQHLFNLYISVRPHNYEASNAFVKGVIGLYCNMQRVFGAHVHQHKRQNFAVAFLNYGKPKRQQ